MLITTVWCVALEQVNYGDDTFVTGDPLSASVWEVIQWDYSTTNNANANYPYFHETTP